MAWLACALAAAAAALAMPDGGAAVLRRRLGAEAPLPRASRALNRLGRWLGTRLGRLTPVLGVAAGAGVSVVLVPVVGVGGIAAAFTVTAAVTLGWWLHRAVSDRRRRRAYRRGVVELCDALAGELLAGRTPRDALVVAGAVRAELRPLLAPAVTAARLDGDVPGALRRACVPGAEGLSLLAAAWDVAERSGAGMVELLDRAGGALRDDEEVHREVVAQLASPRTTARLLAVLPAFGLLLGSATGVNPLPILATTPYGLACLVIGISLAALGLWWVERLARGVEAVR